MVPRQMYNMGPKIRAVGEFFALCCFLGRGMFRRCNFVPVIPPLLFWSPRAAPRRPVYPQVALYIGLARTSLSQCFDVFTAETARLAKRQQILFPGL